MSTPPIRSSSRPDIVATESTARPTSPPARVNFKQVLANAGGMAARTAEAAVTVIPGGAVLSTALRGPAVPLVAGPMTPGVAPGVAGASTTPEGPGGAATTPAGGFSSDPQSMLAQQHSNEMEMLMLQQQVSARQNAFTVRSNVMKAESDTAKAVINNIK